MNKGKLQGTRPRLFDGREEEGDRWLTAASGAPVPDERGKGGQGKKKIREKLERRVNRAEREGIGCLWGATGSQNLQSSATEFLSDSPTFLYLFF